MKRRLSYGGRDQLRKIGAVELPQECYLVKIGRIYLKCTINILQQVTLMHVRITCFKNIYQFNKLNFFKKKKKNCPSCMDYQ
jgi:hypothetical protein